MSIVQGAAWADPGATASDDVDGDITSKIVTTGVVDTATPGLYTLTYSVTDAAGNTGSASRVVSVTAAPPAPSDTAATSAEQGGVPPGDGVSAAATLTPSP
jgi:hypothetical protein